MAAVVSGHYEIYVTAVVARDHTHVPGDRDPQYKGLDDYIWEGCYQRHRPK